MGFLNKSQKSKDTAATATKSEPVERQIMRDVAAKLAQARNDLAVAEQHVAQLEHAIGAGTVADEAFRTSPASAAALERIASGDISDGGVSAMLLRQQAARTAQDILPAAKQRVDAAKKAVDHLLEQAHDAAVAFLKLDVNEIAKKYKAAWLELIRVHDLLVGASHALPPPDAWQDGIWPGELHVEVPGFVLSALGNARRLEHFINEAVVEKTHTTWRQAKDRLMSDPDADVTDLIGDVA